MADFPQRLAQLTAAVTQANQIASQAARQSLEVTAGLRQLIGVEQLGPMGRHARDVLSLPPEVMRVDQLRWRAVLGAAVVTAPTAVTIPQDYDFELEAILGSIGTPADNPVNFMLVTFNFREEGRNFNLFTSGMCLGQLVGTSGPVGPMEWPRGMYRFRGGAQITATFDAPGATWAGGNKTVDIVMLGTLVANGKLMRPT